MEEGSHSTGASIRGARAAARLPRGEGSGGRDICANGQCHQAEEGPWILPPCGLKGRSRGQDQDRTG